MKKLLLIAVSITALSSCKKCYKCTATVTYSGTGYNMPTGTSTTEFCGTKKEKEEYERAGTINSTASSGNVTVTQRTTTTCN